MEYEVIKDVGETLKEMICKELNCDNPSLTDPILKNIIGSSNDITFFSPKDEKGKLSLFLYQITENIHLKNQMPINPENSKFPPLYLSLFYLITPTTGDNYKNQILIGKILQILHDNTILRGSILQNSLKGEELRVILNNLSIDELNKIWNIDPVLKSYQLSISIEVTPVKIESTREMQVVRVMERDLDYYEKKGEIND